MEQNELLEAALKLAESIRPYSLSEEERALIEVIEQHRSGSSLVSEDRPLQRFTLVVDSFGQDGARHIESMSSVWCSDQGQVLSDADAWSVVEGYRPSDYDYQNEWVSDCMTGDRVTNYLRRCPTRRNEARSLPKDRFFLKLLKLLRLEPDGSPARELAEKFDTNPLSEENHRKNLACARTRQRRL
jgi:hypothetical protein